MKYSANPDMSRKKGIPPCCREVAGKGSDRNNYDFLNGEGSFVSGNDLLASSLLLRPWKPETERWNMRLAITCTEPNLESPVSTPQGRTKFILLLGENGEVQQTIPCSDRETVWGVGLSLAHLFVNRGVKAFLTPFCGPFCFKTLQLVGIEVVTGIQGRVQDVVTSYQQGNLEPTREPNIDWNIMNEDHEMQELLSRLQRFSGQKAKTISSLQST